MRAAVFGTKRYDREYLEAANAAHGHQLRFLEPALTADTAALAHGFDAVCAFVNDDLSPKVLDRLAAGGVRLVALRSAGFNNVDLDAASAAGITVTRVPQYSPHAVAEHTVALMLALNRHIPRAWSRVREGNFAIDGLLGFDMHGRTVGIVGTGRIGTVVARIMLGFGCAVVAHDPMPCRELSAAGVGHRPLHQLLQQSDIVTLHCPLTPQTHHLIDEQALGLMRSGAMLINTSRGALIDAASLIAALKGGRLRYVGLDVYEEEAHVFFEDLSDRVLQDDVLARLLTFPNVLITSHQAFFTEEALHAISSTTIATLDAFERGRTPDAVTLARPRCQADDRSSSEAPSATTRR